MKKNILIILVPIIVLATLYFKTKKTGIHGKFERSIRHDIEMIPIDTINLLVEPDGITAFGNDVWLNNRFSLKKLNSIEATVNLNSSLTQNPIISFHVEGDTIYLFQANTKIIQIYNTLNGTPIRGFKFEFPTSYFIKMKGAAFLFQEHILGSGGVRIHYKDYTNNTDKIVNNVFPDSIERGSGMKYAGNWVQSHDRNNYFFSSFRGDIIYSFDKKGNIKDKIKAIDYRNQELKVIQEGNRYYLDPSTYILRIGSSTINNLLLLSSYVREERQTLKEFKNNLTIDVYSIIDKKYLYSFYVPNFLNKKGSEFTITQDGKLYLLFGKNIVVYNLKEHLK